MQFLQLWVEGNYTYFGWGKQLFNALLQDCGRTNSHPCVCVSLWWHWPVWSWTRTSSVVLSPQNSGDYRRTCKNCFWMTIIWRGKKYRSSKERFDPFISGPQSFSQLFRFATVPFLPSSVILQACCFYIHMRTDSLDQYQLKLWVLSPKQMLGTW